MIYLINNENKHFYNDLIDRMFLHRKKVFIDRLGWNLTATNNEERDEFDTNDTIYLVVVDDETQKIRSSLRLNPTSKAHLMSELFSHLCENGVPRGEDIWEISRYCYNPDFTIRIDRVKAFAEILCGVMETALLYGWENLTFVVGTPLIPHCIASGWDMSPLGLPTKDNGQTICAFNVNVTQEGLKATRKNACLTAPAIRFITREIAA